MKRARLGWSRRAMCALAVASFWCAGSAFGQAETCADAGLHAISVGVPFTGNFAGSTNDGPTGCSPTSAGVTQWATFTPVGSGRYTIALCESAHTDTHLGLTLATAPCSGAATYIGCNDDACGYGSQIVADLVGGTAYRLRIGTFGTEITNGGGYVLLITEQVGSAPANDDCGLAGVVMAGSPVAGTVNGATGTNDNSCGGSADTNDVYYTFTSGSAGVYRFSACASEFSPVISVHSGCPASSGNQLSSGCAVPVTPSGLAPLCANRGATVTPTLGAGETVYVRVAGRSDQTMATTPVGVPQSGFGSFELNVVEVTAPANDLCANAETIGSFPYSATADNLGATNDGSLGGCESFGDLWYTFSASLTGVALLNESGGQDVAWAAYDADPCGGAAASLSCSTTDSGVSFPVTMGTQYWIRLGAQTGSTSRTSAPAFTIDLFESPANDTCANAETVMSFPFAASVANIGATGDGSLGGCDRAFDAWYTFTAGANGAAVLNETGSQDAAWGAYNADPCGGGVTNILCTTTDTGLSFPVTMGTQYWVRVGANSTTTSRATPLAVSIELIVAPANDACANAEMIGSLPFGTTVANLSATSDGSLGGCDRAFDVWYTWTAVASGAVVLSETGSQDSSWAAYDADPCGGGATSLVCTTTDSGNVLFPVFQGTTYWFRAGANSASSSRTTALAIDIQFIPSPTNDSCDDADVLDILSSGSVSHDGRAAISDDDASCNSGSALETLSGVWYTFTTGPDGGVLNLNETSSADTVKQLFTGASCGGLSPLECVDTENSNHVLSSDTTYYLLLGVWSATTRPSVAYAFSFSFIPAMGACCDGSNCSISTASACSGAYEGDGTNCAGDPQYVAAGLPVPIADEVADVAGVTEATVEVPDSGTVSTLAAVVDIFHSWVGDITIRLVGPGGSPELTLLTRPGRALDCEIVGDSTFGSSNDLNGVYTFADAGSQSANSAAVANTVLPTGEYSPSACLNTPVSLDSTFAGVSITGTWTLRVTDHADAFTGQLRGFSLSINGGTPVCSGGPALCPGDHNADMVVDLADLISFNTSWQPNIGLTVPPGTQGDYNGDGAVDLADLIGFNTEWQPNIGVPCP